MVFEGNAQTNCKRLGPSADMPGQFIDPEEFILMVFYTPSDDLECTNLFIKAIHFGQRQPRLVHMTSGDEYILDMSDRIN